MKHKFFLFILFLCVALASAAYHLTARSVAEASKLPTAAVKEKQILRIDRSQPFDPAKLLGPDWSIWRGPADGDGLTGEEDQDARSLALTEIDFSKICLKTYLKEEEEFIPGEEWLRRIKAAGRIRLDAKVFQVIWKNRNSIPKSWKDKAVFFCGTTFRGPDGSRYVLYLCWLEGGWRWRYSWLGYDWYSHVPSAVLAE